MCKCVGTCKLQIGNEIHQPIPVPQKVWRQINSDLTEPLKEIGYKYIVTAVDYTSNFVQAEPLKKKADEAVPKFLYKLLYKYSSCDIHIRDQER